MKTNGEITNVFLRKGIRLRKGVGFFLRVGYHKEGVTVRLDAGIAGRGPAVVIGQLGMITAKKLSEIFRDEKVDIGALLEQTPAKALEMALADLLGEMVTLFILCGDERYVNFRAELGKDSLGFISSHDLEVNEELVYS